MRALIASPEAEEHIEMGEVAEPAPGPSETLVRVKAISLNRGEVNRLAGAEQGARLGWDIAGVVERESLEEGGLPVGTRVVGFVYGAGWAELVAISNQKLAEIPSEVTFAAASTLPVAGLTALRLVRLGGLVLGKRVLVTGASGGVGRFAVQLAARAGAEVTAVSRGSDRSEGLEELGASHIVAEIDEAEGPFDLILESVGGQSLAAALKLIAPQGTVATFGNSSRQPTTLDISTFYGRHSARLQAFSLLSPLTPQDFRTDLAYLAQELSAGGLDPQVGYEGDWNDAGAALTALRERTVRGKAVLIVD